MPKQPKLQPVLPPRPDFATLDSMAAHPPREDRIALMNLIGDLNLAWSNTESMFIYVIMVLSGTDERVSAIIFATLNTTRARLDLIQRLARINLPDKALRLELNRIIEDFSKATKLRNDLSHATFIFGEDGSITHTQNMKIEESRSGLQFGVRRPVDSARIHMIVEQIDTLRQVNRRIWDLIQSVHANLYQEDE